MSNIKLKNFDILVLVSFILAGFGIYVWGVNSPYHFDDNYNILRNQFVHDLKYFFQYFTDPRTHNVLPENAPYRPLSTLTYALLWAIGNGSTIPFHIYKIFLHILAAWLGYKILVKGAALQSVLENTDSASLRLVSESVNLQKAAWLGALIFLIHPANSETVNYISSNSTLQCSVLYLSAFYFFLDKKYFLMAILFFCSLLTKEEGATLPAAIVLYGIVFDNFKINKKAVFISSLVLIAFLALYVSMPKTVNYAGVDTLTYLFTQFRAWLKYFIWIFIPIDFSIEHKGFGFSYSFFDWQVIGSLLIHVLVLGFSIFTLWKKRGTLSYQHKTLFFGIFWFYLVMLPTSSVFALFEPINEHRYYLSYVLFIPALLVYLSSLSSHCAFCFSRYKFYFEKLKISESVLRKIIMSLCMGICIALSFLSIREVVIWKTALAVWQNAVEKDPENGRAYLNLGVQYLNLGRYDEAIDNFHLCLKFNQRYAYCSLNLGITWNNKGELDQAEFYLAQAVQWDSDLILALAHYGEFLIVRRQKYEEGLKFLDICTEKSQGGFAHCYSGKATALRALGRANEALIAANQLFKLQPIRIHAFDVALSLIALGRWDESYAIFSKLREENPNDVQSIHNLAWIEMQRGNWQQAKNLWFEKLKIVNDDVPTWQQLKIVAENLKDQDLSNLVNEKLK